MHIVNAGQEPAIVCYPAKNHTHQLNHYQPQSQFLKCAPMRPGLPESLSEAPREHPKWLTSALCCFISCMHQLPESVYALVELPKIYLGLRRALETERFEKAGINSCPVQKQGFALSFRKRLKFILHLNTMLEHIAALKSEDASLQKANTVCLIFL